jgi:glycosyltransferase involved in cell wall biosynthesis
MKAGHTVKILAWDRDENYKEKREEIMVGDISIPIIRFGIKASFGEGIKNLKQFLCFQFRMGKWLYRHRKEYDCIHACDFDTAFTSSVVNHIVRKNFVFDIFDYLSTDAKSGLSLIIKKLENYIINYAHAVIICSEKRREQIKDTNPKKLIVIHNSPSVPENIIKFALRGLPGKIKIAYVGILQDFRLLEEIVEFVKREPILEFHVGGFGKYEDFFKNNDIKESNIFYYGRLKYEDTLSLESSCDIMTAIYAPWISNHKYAAPNKFYEALMLGKPVIMVEGTGMSEIVEKEEIGKVIKYDGEEFINAVKGIQKQLGEKREIISDRMKKIYYDEYSWDEMERRLLKLYSEW